LKCDFPSRFPAWQRQGNDGRQIPRWRGFSALTPNSEPQQRPDSVAVERSAHGPDLGDGLVGRRGVSHRGTRFFAPIFLLTLVFSPAGFSG
jgi:hypothetical protein